MLCIVVTPVLKFINCDATSGNNIVDHNIANIIKVVVHQAQIVSRWMTLCRYAVLEFN